MREWLLIICTSAFCSDMPTALQVTEGQCRAVIKVADEILEMNREGMKVAARPLAGSLRAICIPPDGKTRLDNWPWRVGTKSQAK